MKIKTYKLISITNKHMQLFYKDLNMGCAETKQFGEHVWKQKSLWKKTRFTMQCVSTYFTCNFLKNITPASLLGCT